VEYAATNILTYILRSCVLYSKLSAVIMSYRRLHICPTPAGFAPSTLQQRNRAWLESFNKTTLSRRWLIFFYLRKYVISATQVTEVEKNITTNIEGKNVGGKQASKWLQQDYNW